MTSVLFVDDEPKVLDGLRRMLRTCRNQWRMDFCSSPREALDKMAIEPFDIVVTDMRMPEMDGAELLSRIREMHPETVRIVLSGQSEHERIFRAVGPAHQYLSKPCDSEQLRQTIARASQLVRRLTNSDLKSFASRLQSLPSLPSIYVELVEEIRRDEASVSRIGDLISRDVSMTAKILQLVNSSFFGLPVHVSDARHAAALLGLNTLRPLVLAAGIFRELENKALSIRFLMDVFEHSLAVAGAARKLALEAQANDAVVDDAFLAAILHDIGKVILAENLGREYYALIQEAEDAHLPLLGFEQDALGTTHADVGGYLLGLWGLTSAVTEAVTYHHDPHKSADIQFSALTAVHIANALANNNRVPGSHESTLDSEYLLRLGIEPNLESWRKVTETTPVSV